MSPTLPINGRPHSHRLRYKWDLDWRYATLAFLITLAVIAGLGLILHYFQGGEIEFYGPLIGDPLPSTGSPISRVAGPGQ